MWLRSILRRFRADQRGNFVTTFALMAPLLVGVVGFGLDQWMALSMKSRLDGAADLAAISAAKAGTDYMNNNAATQSATELQQNALAAAQAAGQGAFAVNAGPAAANLASPPQVTVSYANSQFTASVSYTGQLNTAFGSLLGQTSLSLSKTAIAVNGAPKFIDLVFLIDNSESMGIGATVADQQLMQSQIGCTFACHIPAPNGNPLGGDELTVLHNLGSTAQTRMDVVRTSVVNQLNLLQSTTYSGQVQVSIYEFSHGITTLVDHSTKWSEIMSAANSIELATSVGTGGTFSTNAVETLANMLPSAGDGSSSSSRSGAVLIFTDGVQDNEYWTDVHCWCFSGYYGVPSDYIISYPNTFNDSVAEHIEPFDSSSCAGFAPLNYAVYSLDFEYFIDTSTLGADPRAKFINGIKPAIQSNMAACASSPNNAAVASTPTEFQTAMNRLIQQATSTLRLTQ